MNMKARIFLSIILLILLCATYELGYRIGYNRGRYGVVLVGLDDPKRGPPQTATESEWEPYFTRGNPIPTRIR